mgnify:CR=1 FL=1
MSKKDKKKSEEILRYNIAERYSKKIEDILSKMDFSSEDELREFIKKVRDKYKDFEPPPKTPLDKARDIIYDAWESDREERIRLAEKALEISKDCADAYVLLAEASEDLKESYKLYKKGVEVGERALGEKIFEEQVGHFWGIVKTRPYMRARYGYAECLWNLGEEEQAIKHLKDMLRLNPNDNQGVRYFMINCLIEMGNDEDAWELLKNYSEYSASWAYTRALLMFRREGDSVIANTLLNKAFEVNKYVAKILTGEKELPDATPVYYSPGSIEEAEIYIGESLGAWNTSKGSLEWTYENYKKFKRRN